MLYQVLRMIQEGECQALIEKIREQSDKEERNKLKQQLPAITVSGVFQGGRKQQNLLQHTGLLQIDIDAAEDPEATKQQLTSDIHTMVAFISPSSKGVKLIVRIPRDKDQHKQSFSYVEAYFLREYGISIDKSCSDVSRLMFLSYDPEIYINEQATPFNIAINGSGSKAGYSCDLPEERKASLPIQSEMKDPNIREKDRSQVESLIESIEADRLDIAQEYPSWLKIGFALVDGFGEEGRVYFHRVSQFHPAYDPVTCDEQYTKCINGNRPGEVTVATFIMFARDALKARRAEKAAPKNNFEDIKEENEPDHNKTISTKAQDKEIVFYRPKVDKDGQITDVTIEYEKFIQLLLSFGFRRFDVVKDFILVRITENVMKEIPATYVQDFLIDYLRCLPETVGGGVPREILTEKIHKSPSTYFSDSRLSLLKGEGEIVLKTQGKDISRLYFENGFVECTKNGYRLRPYSELDGVIWEKQRIPRKFIPSIGEGEEHQGMWERFIGKICNDDVNRMSSLMSIMGYALHPYFDVKRKAVVITDSTLSDTTEGRSGKTLLVKGMEQVRSTALINGKDFRFDNKHRYQQAELGTQIVCLNDLKNSQSKPFPFEQLFNDITEGITVDRKNQQPFTLQAKMVITTNNPLNLEGGSSRDRAIEFELSDHYSEKYSPQDEFGCWFFTGWDEVEWAKFDRFMAQTIVTYLLKGIVLVEPINLHRRKLRHSTCEEFVDFMETMREAREIVTGKEYNKKTLFERFQEDYPDRVAQPPWNRQQIFTKALVVFAQHSSGFCNAYEERKSGKDRFITFKRDG